MLVRQRAIKQVWVSDIVDEGWILYDSEEAMQEAYDLEFVKVKPKKHN